MVSNIEAVKKLKGSFSSPSTSSCNGQTMKSLRRDGYLVMLLGGPSAGVKRSLVDRTRTSLHSNRQILVQTSKDGSGNMCIFSASGILNSALSRVCQVLEGIAGVVDIQCITYAGRS